jgi:protein-L-isoaspartate(D-aspartate) O-methyltransferase
VAAGHELNAYRRDRRRLVERLRAAGIEDLAILHAFDTVPRHRFVPEAMEHQAYDEAALPIGYGQTISRPSVHAFHLQLARVGGGERVLEVGTGSGFQTALLASLGADVYSIERVEPLAEAARRRIAEIGLTAHIRVGDGSRGWVEHAPFDVILVGAAAPQLPGPLLAQLADGGCLIAPVGEERQALVRVTRTGNELVRETVDQARFVPLVERG